MFETLETAPTDPILGLSEAFRNDANPAKINLGVGVYKDATGHTPVLTSVEKAQMRLLESETTKSYLPIDGDPTYSRLVRGLLFGADHGLTDSGQAVTIQAPGGTGALRVAADFIHSMWPQAGIWISDPTWANHPQIFKAAGLTVKTYPYFDAATNNLNFNAMLAAFDTMPGGDVVLLHGCCHNPTGVDPTPQQWEQIADVVEARGLLALVDFAYQGLGDGLEADAVGLRRMCRPGLELLVASSFSKNFGLYNERIGALTLVAANADAAQLALGHLKICVRTNYSNPPAHGGGIVATILEDVALKHEWEDEVAQMRDRINGMRRLLVETLKTQGVDRDFSFIQAQRGMFSFSGLNKDQVEALRAQHSIYIVGSGRINVAGITEGNINRLCQALAQVMA